MLGVVVLQGFSEAGRDTPHGGKSSQPAPFSSRPVGPPPPGSFRKPLGRVGGGRHPPPDAVPGGPGRDGHRARVGILQGMLERQKKHNEDLQHNLWDAQERLKVAAQSPTGGEGLAGAQFSVFFVLFSATGADPPGFASF